MMEDQELKRLARRLGARAERQIDVDQVAERVVHRLRDATEQPKVGATRWGNRRVWRGTLRIAAILAVLVTGGLVLRSVVMPPDPTSEFAAPVALDDLSASELTDVLDSLEFSGPVRHVGTGGIDDLSNAELEELLVMMEG